MGLKAARLLAPAAAALLVALAAAGAAAAGPATGSARFLESRQSESGGFAETGRPADATLTAWAVLGLVAANGSEPARSRALAYLRAAPLATESVAGVALRVLALEALGGAPDALLEVLRRHRPGELVNETIWVVLALRAAGERPPPALVSALRAAQLRDGGWSWTRRGVSDSNDTAAAIQALRASGVGGTVLRRGVAALRSFQNADGGFGLVRAKASDAQSTAWAIQALLAAGTPVGKAPFRFLARLRRADGSYRYSLAYGTTPVWVTAQVLPALSGRPYPLR